MSVEEITLKSRLDRAEEIMKKYDNLFVMASQYVLLEQENQQLKREVEKLYTIRVEYGCFIENTHIIDDYKIAQLIKNKYLIELNDGTFADIHEVVKQNKERDLYKSVIDKLEACLEENRNSYIYQDGLGEDWYFQDLDVFDELNEIIDKAKVKNEKNRLNL